MTDGLFLSRVEEFWKRIWRRKIYEAHRRRSRIHVPIPLEAHRQKRVDLAFDPWSFLDPWESWEVYWKRILNSRSDEALRRQCLRRPITTDWGSSLWVLDPWDLPQTLHQRPKEEIGTSGQGMSDHRKEELDPTLIEENGFDFLFLDATGCLKCVSLPRTSVKNDQLTSPFVFPQTKPLTKTLSNSYVVNMGLPKTSLSDSCVVSMGPHGHSSGQEEAGTSGLQEHLADHIHRPLHTAGGIETSKQGMESLSSVFVLRPPKALPETLSDSHQLNMGLLETSSYDSYVVNMEPHEHSSGQEEAGTSGVQGRLADRIHRLPHMARAIETSKQGMESLLSMFKERDHLDGCYKDRQVLLDLMNIIFKVGSGITAFISAGTVGTSLLLAQDSELYVALQQHGSLPYLTISAFGFGVAAIVAAVMSYIPIGHIRATVQYIRRASQLASVLLTISFISLNAAYITAGITVAKYHPNMRATIATIGVIPFLVLLACFLNVAGVKRN